MAKFNSTRAKANANLTTALYIQYWFTNNFFVNCLKLHNNFTNNFFAIHNIGLQTDTFSRVILVVEKWGNSGEKKNDFSLYIILQNSI